MNNNEHRNLCLLATRWLRATGRVNPVSCPYAVIELVAAIPETPDVFGWNYWTTVLVGVKISRRDFLADAKKEFRSNPEQGIGEYRYYCCPNGLIGVHELPDKWGLIYESCGVLTVVKEAERQIANYRFERIVLSSVVRRLARPQLFNFRKIVKNTVELG